MAVLLSGILAQQSVSQTALNEGSDVVPPADGSGSYSSADGAAPSADVEGRWSGSREKH